MRRAEVLRGTRAIAPLAAAAFPFGLVYGVVVVESSTPDWVGGLASSIIIAGAAQLALLDLVDQGAPALVAVATALVINARFVMYSAALAPHLARYPRRQRLVMASMITDQLAGTSLLELRRNQPSPQRWRWFYVGAGMFMIGAWILGTWIGIGFGANLPEALPLAFIVPLMFIALLVPWLRARGEIVAAAVAAAVVVLAQAAPYNSGLLIGAVVGILAGLVASR